MDGDRELPMIRNRSLRKFSLAHPLRRTPPQGRCGQLKTFSAVSLPQSDLLSISGKNDSTSSTEKVISSCIFKASRARL